MRIEYLKQARHLIFISADETNEIEMGRDVSITKIVLANCGIVYFQKLPPVGVHTGPSPLCVLYDLHVTKYSSAASWLQKLEFPTG